MRLRYALLTGLTLLAACGKKMDSGSTTTTSTTDTAAPATTDTALGVPAAAKRIAQAVAYMFSLQFRLSGSALAQVQIAQEDACERLGPGTCIVLGSSLEGRDGQFGQGTLDVLIAADAARPLARAFARIVTDSKGNLIRSDVAGEVLDGAIAQAHAVRTAETARRSEAEATLAAARATRARLASGYEAGTARAAQANAILEAQALAARVRTSRIAVRYESDLPVPMDRGRPFALAWSRAGENLSEGATTVFTIAVTLAPFALAGGLLVLGWRVLRRWRGLLPSAEPT